MGNRTMKNEFWLICLLVLSGCFTGPGGDKEDPSDTAPAEDLEVVWTVDVGGAVTVDALIGSGVLVVGTSDGELVGLDPASGIESWRSDAQGRVSLPMAFHGGTVLVGHADDAYAYDVTDGSHVWNLLGDATAYVECGEVRLGTYASGVTITCDDLGLMVCSLSTELGSVDCTSGAFAGYVLGHAASDGNRVWFGSGDLYGAMVGEDQWDWRLNTLEDASFSAPGVGDGIVATTDDAGTLYAVEEQTGEELWTWSVPAGVTGGVIVEDGLVFVGDEQGTLTALSAASGGERWSFSADQAIRGHATVANGAVYFGSNDGSAYALDVDDGTELWRFETSDSVIAAPIVHGDLILVASADGSVTALR